MITRSLYGPFGLATPECSWCLLPNISPRFRSHISFNCYFNVSITVPIGQSGMITSQDLANFFTVPPSASPFPFFTFSFSLRLTLSHPATSPFFPLQPLLPSTRLQTVSPLQLTSATLPPVHDPYTRLIALLILIIQPTRNQTAAG